MLNARVPEAVQEELFQTFKTDLPDHTDVREAAMS
jgi:hypothetical protein